VGHFRVSKSRAISGRGANRITLGSAPLENVRVRSVLLGQLGETRRDPALDSDIAGEHKEAAALDAATNGPFKGILKIDRR
jgi:hypothetical protein